MKEISLHLLDVAKNSIAADAKAIDLVLEEGADHECTMSIRDDGCGMDAEFLARVTDPFTTTRTTRKVGLGLPLLCMMAMNMFLSCVTFFDFPFNIILVLYALQVDFRGEDTGLPPNDGE